MRNDSQPPVTAIWIVGSYNGEQAKRVRSLANEGIGYFLEDDTGKGSVIAYSRYVVNGEPVPHHLQKVTSKTKIDYLEKRLQERLS